MLEKVRFRDYGKGVEVRAFTDGYAYDEYFSLYLLSVAGRDSNVKAITSAAVSGGFLDLMSAGVREVRAPYGARYRIMSGKLPGGGLHQVVAEERFFDTPDRPRKLLYAGDEDPVGLVYEAVRSACPVPLVREWSEWLYGRLRRAGSLTELQGTAKVLRLDVTEKLLDTLVSEGVSSGEISF